MQFWTMFPLKKPSWSGKCSYYIKGPTKIAYKSRTGYCSSGQEGGDMRRGRFSGPERPRRRPRRTVPRPGLRRNLRRTDPLYCSKRARKPSRVLIFVSTITWRSYRLLWSPIPEISRSFDMHNRRKIRWTKNLQVLYVFWGRLCISLNTYKPLFCYYKNML